MGEMTRWDLCGSAVEYIAVRAIATATRRKFFVGGGARRGQEGGIMSESVPRKTH